MSSASSNTHINAYYYYLDIKYETLLDKEKNKLSESKFNEFINQPAIFTKSMFNNIIDERDDEKLKEKKNFIETCFLFFSPFAQKFEKSLHLKIFNIFKSKKDEKLSLERMILIIDSILLKLLSKVNEKNPETIFMLLLRINEILKYCFLEKSYLCSLEFENCLANNPVSKEIIEFIILCASPINNEFIKIIKKFISEDNFNLVKNHYKLENEKEKRILFLEKMLISSEEDRTFYEQHTDEVQEWEDSVELKIYKYRLSTQKNVLNTKNLQRFLNQKISGNLRFFHGENTRNDRNFDSDIRFFGFHRIYRISNLSSVDIDYYRLESKKKYEYKFEDIDKYLVSSENESLNLFDEKIKFPNINKKCLKSLLLELLFKLNEIKVNEDFDNEFICEYYTIKNPDEDLTEENYEFYCVKIIDEIILFFKNEKKEKNIKASKLIKILMVEELEIFGAKEEKFVTFKNKKNEEIHKFKFEEEKTISRFIEVFNNQSLKKTKIDRKILYKNSRLKYIFEDLKHSLMTSLTDKLNAKLFYDKEIREYFELNFVQPTLNKVFVINRNEIKEKSNEDIPKEDNVELINLI